MTNPESIFTVGGTVEPGRGLYVTRQADGELLNLCREGSYAYLLTSRQMGKSSLMIQAAIVLQEEGVRTAIIDLSLIGKHLSPEEWYFGLLEVLEGELELEFDVFDWWKENAHLGYANRFEKFFRYILEERVQERIVVFVDEIDTTLDMEFADDFYVALRGMYNARALNPVFNRVSFVLIGVASPNELVKDSTRTPFNIGQRVELTDFTEQEALHFVSGFNFSDDTARQVIRWVLKWTAGHPFLTQQVFQLIAVSGRVDWTESDVDRIIADTYFDERSDDTHLMTTWNMVTERAPEALRPRVIRTFRRIVRSSNGVKINKGSLDQPYLVLSGIVKRVGDRLVLRNNIYEHVFNREWIERHAPLTFVQKHEEKIVPAFIALLILLVASVVIGILAGTLGRVSEENIALTENIEQLKADSTRISNEIESLSGSLRAMREDFEGLKEDTLLLSDQITGQMNELNSLIELLAITEENQRALLEDIERARIERDALVEERDALQEERDALDTLVIESNYKTLSVALAAQSKRQYDIEEDRRAAILAVTAKTYDDLSRGKYRNEVLDALQLTQYAADDWFDASVLISDREVRSEILDIAYHPTQYTIAYADNSGRIKLWRGMDVPVKTSKDSLGSKVEFLAFSSSGKRLAALQENRRLLIWNNETSDWAKEDISEPDDRISLDLGRGYPADFILVDDNVAAVAIENRVVRYDIAEGEKMQPLLASDTSTCRSIRALVSRSSEVIAGCSNGTLLKWQGSEGLEAAPEVLDVSSARMVRVDALAMSPDGNSLAMGVELVPENSEDTAYGILILHVDAGVDSLLSDDHQGPVNSLAYRNDWLASGSADGTVRLWPLGPNDAEAPGEISNIILREHRRWVRAVGFDPEGKYLVSGSADGTVREWTLDTDFLKERICERLTGVSEEELREVLDDDFDYQEFDFDSFCATN